MPDTTEDKPKKTPAKHPFEEFLKSSEETLDNAINEVLDKRPPEAETFKQKVTLWLIRSLIALLVTSAVPLGTAAFTYGKEKAKLDMEVKKKESEARLRQRKLQLQLLKQVIDVAKKADFSHPSSVYQLGLIAHMVNENSKVFGIELSRAEETMKRMFQRLAPITGLRRRMAESDILITSLAESLILIRKNEKLAEDQVNGLKKKLMQMWKLPAWKRRKFEAQLSEKEHDLTVYRTKEEFYSKRLDRERALRKYFQEELAKQANSLKKLLQDVVDLRDRLHNRLFIFKQLIKEVLRESDSAVFTVPKLEKSIKAIDNDFSYAWNMIQRLVKEVESEGDETDILREQLQQCMAQCSEDTVCVKVDTVTPGNIQSPKKDEIKPVPATPAPRRRAVPKMRPIKTIKAPMRRRSYKRPRKRQALQGVFAD